MKCLSLFAAFIVGASAASSDSGSVLDSIVSSIKSYLPSTSLQSTNFIPNTDQILKDYAEPVNEQILRNSHVVRKGTELQLGGKRWTASGANVYWLGLDENVVPPPDQPYYEPLKTSYPTHGRITEAMNILVTMGAHTIRSQTLGVSVGNPLSLQPSLGTFNNAAFDPIDWAVYQARTHGLRIFPPLVDNYDYYHGGKYSFLRFRGIDIDSTASPVDPRVNQFYTNATIIADFKAYIRHLLTHVNPYTGLSYADDPTIFAYETGNELGGPVFGDKSVPNSWTHEICSFVKELAPNKLCIDGTYGVNPNHLNISSVDAYDNHFYPPNLAQLSGDIKLVEGAGKVYFAGEYDWTANNPSSATLDEFFGVMEERQTLPNPVVAGDLFWSLFGHNVPDCNNYVNHTDGFTLQYGSPTNTAQNDTQISTIRQHFSRMQGLNVSSYLPAVACPGKLADLTYSPGVMDFEGDVY